MASETLSSETDNLGTQAENIKPLRCEIVHVSIETISKTRFQSQWNNDLCYKTQGAHEVTVSLYSDSSVTNTRETGHVLGVGFKRAEGTHS